MTAQGVLGRSCFDLLTGWQLTIAVVIMFVLLVADRALAQQDSSDAASNPQSADSAVVDQNRNAQSADSSQQPSLPNAPSAAARTYKPVGELTFGDRFTIYRKTILRPYSIVGPALVRASVNGKTSRLSGDRERKATAVELLLA